MRRGFAAPRIARRPRRRLLELFHIAGVISMRIVAWIFPWT
jgi:hypothetical protein